MSPPELLPEIWVRVIYHVRRPLPSPTGTHPIAAVRQPELATLMRVSKLFNNLVSTHLYKIVVTDHLPSFIYNLNRPAAATGIRSKTELIQLVRRLYLEYASREETSYLTLMSRGADYFSLFAADWTGCVRHCSAEADWIATSAAAMKSTPKALISLSTGAFCGGDWRWEGLWVSRSQDYLAPDLKERIIQANYAVLSIAVYHKRMAYYCHRVGYGPLSFAAARSDGNFTEPGWAGAHGLEHRYHCDARPGLIPAVTGGKSRFYCTFKHLDRDDPREMQMAGQTLAQEIDIQIKTRASQIARNPGILARMEKAGTLASFDIEIYLPSFWSDDHQAAFLKFMVDEKMPKSAHTDVVKYRKIEEAPMCDACLWCFADEPEQVSTVRVPAAREAHSAARSAP